MSEPFLSEIRLMAFNYAPRGWAQCNGQQLPINNNQALFSLIGTTYGGNGQTTFALPDFRGRVPIHMGQGHTIGELAGQEATTLTLSQMPQHTHFAKAATTNASADTPDSPLVLATAALDLYRSPTHLAAMDPGIVSSVGGSQPHINMQPYLTLMFCICLQGIFPSRS